MRGKRDEAGRSSLRNIDQNWQEQAARAHGSGITDIYPHIAGTINGHHSAHHCQRSDGRTGEHSAQHDHYIGD